MYASIRFDFFLLFRCDLNKRNLAIFLVDIVGVHWQIEVDKNKNKTSNDEEIVFPFLCACHCVYIFIFMESNLLNWCRYNLIIRFSKVISFFSFFLSISFYFISNNCLLFLLHRFFLSFYSVRHWYSHWFVCDPWSELMEKRKTHWYYP